MKQAIVFMLIGLLALGAAPSFANGNPNGFVATSTVSLDPSNGFGSDMSDPSRDPAGEDEISYCGDPSVYWSTGNASQIWARVRFTAPSAFTLQMLKAAPSNPNNVAVAFTISVYRENGNNLGQRVYTTTLNNGLPADGAPWYEFDLGENNYVDFEEGETFSVLYGPCPGQNPGAGGRGYWPQSDGAGNFNDRSYLFLGAQPSNDHGQWTDVVRTLGGGDLCVRANGSLAQFIDLSVSEVYNSNQNIPFGGRFHVKTGESKTIYANLKNIGPVNVDVAIVTFNCQDIEGNALWSRDVVVEGINAHDSVQVECDTVFSSDEAGRFYIWASVFTDDDANEENNISGLEQTTWDPIDGADEFISYTDGIIDGSIGGDGFGACYPKPADEFIYELRGFRVLVFPTIEEVQEVPVAAGVFDRNNQRYQFFFMDTLLTDGTLDSQYVTVNLTEELPDSAQIIMAGPTEMFAIFARAGDGLRIGQDGTPPSAGVNQLMPSVMWFSTADFGQVGPSESSDYAIEAQIAKSNRLPAGAFMRVEPDTLDFGLVSAGRDHTIEAMFIGTGSDTVNVTRVAIPVSLRNFVRIDRQVFSVASAETTFVTLTFRADVDTSVTGTLIVSSNWEGRRNFNWRLRAQATLTVNEHVQPGMPGEYALNQNYPNPFNPTTSIGFALVKAGEVSFGVYDMTGRQIGELFNGRLDAGYHSFDFDANDLPAGVYTYRLTAGEFTSSKKMVLMK